jgi:biopolymer transport protein ExbB/TolQ
METLYNIMGNATYGALALNALWGLFCVVLVIRRINQIRFKNEEQQAEFLGELDSAVSRGDFEGASSLCEGDVRVMPQLAWLAISNRHLGYQKLRHVVADRFQRDILSDLEYRVGWINSMIKTAPMLGLYGTVLGMMGAFGKLYAGGKVSASALAGDISLALLTTAIGLTIAIPLLICVASINIRIKKMEELVGAGLTQFFDSLKAAMTGTRAPAPAAAAPPPTPERVEA